MTVGTEAIAPTASVVRDGEINAGTSLLPPFSLLIQLEPLRRGAVLATFEVETCSQTLLNVHLLGGSKFKLTMKSSYWGWLPPHSHRNLLVPCQWGMERELRGAELLLTELL